LEKKNIQLSDDILVVKKKEKFDINQTSPFCQILNQNLRKQFKINHPVSNFVGRPNQASPRSAEKSPPPEIKVIPKRLTLNEKGILTKYDITKHNHI
jgi:hypothetical protein